MTASGHSGLEWLLLNRDLPPYEVERRTIPIVSGPHQCAPSVPFAIKSADSADGALSFSKARKKILLARSTVTSTWRSAELRIKLRSVSLSHFSKNVRAFL